MWPNILLPSAGLSACPSIPHWTSGSSDGSVPLLKVKLEDAPLHPSRGRFPQAQGTASRAPSHFLDVVVHTWSCRKVNLYSGPWGHSSFRCAQWVFHADTSFKKQQWMERNEHHSDSEEVWESVLGLSLNSQWCSTSHPDSILRLQ